MRRFVGVVGALVLLGSLAAPAVTAGMTQSVTIVSVMNVTGDGDPNWGTFEASGPAVTRHLVCARGTVTDTYLVQVDEGWEVGKAFVCDGHHDTFLVTVLVRPRDDGTERLAWSVQGGGGAFRVLSGGGRGTSTPLVDQQVTNTYTGTLMSW